PLPGEGAADGFANQACSGFAVGREPEQGRLAGRSGAAVRVWRLRLQSGNGDEHQGNYDVKPPALAHARSTSEVLRVLQYRSNLTSRAGFGARLALAEAAGGRIGVARDSGGGLRNRRPQVAT